MPNDDYPFDYGNAPADGYLPTSPGSTAPQPRIVQDAPTVQMRRPATPQQNLPAEPVAYPQRGQRPYAYSASPYDPDTYDPSPAKPDRQARQSSRRDASQQPATAQPRRGASALRWIARLLCLGLLVFGAMTIYYLTEQS